jgi:hypothetical protein
MRIGTWNLDAEWDQGYADLLQTQQCDVWLLTEVSPEAVGPAGKIAGFYFHLTAGVMPRGQHFAAVLSRDNLAPLPDPHPASAAAVVNGSTFVSFVLPWSGCQKYPPTPWVGETVGQMVQAAIDTLMNALPRSGFVWGGDWNQNLVGGWEHVGSRDGRAVLELALQSLNLQVPTAELAHGVFDGSHAIDHIAVPSTWLVQTAVLVKAELAGKRLSDHDAYVVDVIPE